MQNNVDPNQAAELFDNILRRLGREDLESILFNWNESELDENTNEILMYVDARAYGPGTGGASKVEPIEFINWLLSDAPFDTKVYGEGIPNDQEWTELIQRAREFVTS